MVLYVHIFQFLCCPQVLYNEILSFGSVLTHIELHDISKRFLIAESYLVQAHILADESLELIPGNLSETFESCDLDLCLKLLDRSFLLLGVVAVAYRILVLDSEEGSLEYEYMSSSDQVRMVFHEECQHKHADVHSVVIGIGCDDDLVISEVVHVVLKSEGVNEQVELLVLGNLLAALLVAVDRLTSQAEHCLSLCLTCLGDGSAR